MQNTAAMFNPSLTVEETIAESLNFGGLPPVIRHDRSVALMEKVGLLESWRRKPPELSGRQRQRLAIARALAASIVSLEFRSRMDRIFNAYDYEAAVMTLASGDVDPNSEMNVWTVNGSTHLWNLSGKAAEGWEGEIGQRLASPHLLVGVNRRVAECAPLHFETLRSVERGRAVS